MALKKGGLKADEAVVIENAPLGVEADIKLAYSLSPLIQVR